MRCLRKIDMIARVAALTLSAVLLGGCSTKTPPPQTTAAESTAESPAAPESKAEHTQIAPETAALMLPVAEGLIRSYEEQGLSYDDQDSAYIWWTLYHIAEADNSDHAQSEIVASGDQLKGYLTAAFSELTELPAIPEELSAMVTRDDGTDSYHFAHQDEPAGESRISGAEAIFGSLYEFTVHFSYPDGSTSDYTLDAVDYPGGTSAPFPYAFISMQPTEYPCTDNC